jgi:ATP-binding cassette subfamily B protein
LPSVIYALAAALALAVAGLALALLAAQRSLRAGEKRRAAALWLGWFVAAAGLLAWTFVAPGAVSLGTAFAWSLVGGELGIRIRRRGRASRAELRAAHGLDAPIPEAARAALGERGISADAAVASIPADVDREGSYAEGLVVVTPERIVSVALLDGRAEIGADIPLAEVGAVRAESLVGGGRLAVSHDGCSGPPEIVARYSNTHGRAFGSLAKALAKHLEARKKAESGEGEEGPGPFSLYDVEDAAPKTCPSCGRVLDENTQVCPACVRRGRVMLRLLGFSGRYWREITVLCLLMILNASLGLVGPYAPKILLDDVFASEVLDGERPASFLGLVEGGPASILLLLVGVLAAAMLLEVAISVARGRIAVDLGARIAMELRARVFHHLQTLSLGYFDKQKTGTLMSRTDHDTRMLQHFLVDGIQFTIINFLQIAGIGVILFFMDWRLAAWTLLPAPLVIILSAFFWRLVIGMFRRLWERVARLSAFLNDSISGVRVVKAFGQEEREKRRFDERNYAVYDGLVTAEKTFATFHPPLLFIMTSGSLIVWFAGGLGVIGREIQLGTLMSFVFYLGRFYGPLRIISRINDWLTRSMTAAERVFEILDVHPDVTEAPDAEAAPRLDGRVELDDVTFGYDKLKPVLKNVSFAVEPGEMIGLVGHSGAGKSTAINLICRLYDVDEGAIRFDGTNVRKLKIDDIRGQIGVVLQETYLFSGSVAENIAYARPGASREEILEASAAANAHDFVMKRPDGYDSDVGERGGRLSVGEKQRIAIARAILHNPRILILDEATSSVDTETERQIQAALERLVRDRTTFAIAHRLSTLRNAHRLVVLENGEVKEIGTHEELIERRGIYWKLVDAQTELSRIVAVGG